MQTGPCLFAAALQEKPWESCWGKTRHESTDAGSKEAIGTQGCKNRGKARRSREGSPSTRHSLRVLLEYCIQFLAPQRRKDIDDLEGVQASATGMLGLEHLPVRSGWGGLEQRLLQWTKKQPRCLCGRHPVDSYGLPRGL